ncbi:BTB/POZ domain-containing protein 1-like [Centruroides vittatus]|uniref:BTB/POZ domain-containing protein 1-like n=1 Tax=Centruroides vittatus TaxID=120091 RepID=UPI00350FD18F
MAHQSNCNDLHKKVASLLYTRDMSDVTITVGEKKTPFQTHKLLLSLFSEKFKSMFMGPSATTSKEIHLTNVNVKAFGIFFNYVYTGDLAINSPEEALSVLMFAHEYGAIEMKDKCVKILAESVPPDIIAELYEASQSLTPESRQESSVNQYESSNTSYRDGDTFKEYSESPTIDTFKECSESSKQVEETSTEVLTQSLPTKLNVDHSNCYIIRTAGKMNNLEERLTHSFDFGADSQPIEKNKFQNISIKNRRPKYYFDASKFLEENCCESKSKENVLDFFSETNFKSEADLNAALKKWGFSMLQLHKPTKLLQKVEEMLLQSEMNKLTKLDEFVDFNTEQIIKQSFLKLSSKCSKTWISSLNFPRVIERFYSSEFDLYVCGVTLNLKYYSVDYRKGNLIAKLEISNLTKNIHANNTISLCLDESDRALSLKLLSPIFVGKDEVCEIVMSSESKLTEVEFVYCGEMCCLDHRLNRLKVGTERAGHFNSIIAFLA